MSASLGAAAAGASNEIGFMERLASPLLEPAFLRTTAGQWFLFLAGAVLAILVSLIVVALIRAVLPRLARRTGGRWGPMLMEIVGWPFRWILFLGLLALVANDLDLPEGAKATLGLILVVAFIVGLTWLAIRAVGVLASALEERFVVDEDVGRSRGARTQVTVLRKIATILLIVLGGALALLQFEMLRTVGTSVLASAGVVGLVVGLAAQRSISNLLAGIQLSITQPIRLDDTVIVEGEWGSVEEITLTYVVVRVWDLRRLIVPVGRFLEQPFQNWTKVRPELLGTIFLHADYRVPIEAVRAEVKRLCEASEKWDGEASGLIVTDVTDRTVELRALVSAADAGSLWDLRCQVREGLVSFLQRLDGGRHLPRVRIESQDERLEKQDSRM